MDKYPEYKHTGIDWLGLIPSHWEVSFLKYTSSHINKKRLPEQGERKISPENVESGTGRIMNYYSDYGTKGLEFQIGDTLLNKLRVYLSKVVFCNFSGLSMGEMIVLRPIKYNPNYQFHLLSSSLFIDTLNSLSEGVKVPRPPIEEIMRTTVPVPPENEQILISKYLDKKTSQIDSLIEKIQQKIELLKEQRTSLINQCVTKGLNPDVQMKNSGVEWIGEIPSHWKVKRLKYFSSVELSSVDRHIVEDEIPVDVCHYTQVYKNEKINKTTKLSKGTCTPQELKKFSLFKGDILLTKDSESPDDIGIPTFIEEVLEGTVCGYHLCHIRVLEREMNPEFLYRFVESTTIQRYFSISSNGVTRFGLGKSTIENMPILLPPPVDQQTIADKINRFSTLILSTISKETKRIELLKEYRRSLVSNVVTGKVKITEEMI